MHGVSSALIPNLSHQLNIGKVAWLLSVGNGGTLPSLIGQGHGLQFRLGATMKGGPARAGGLGAPVFINGVNANSGSALICRTDPVLNQLPAGDFSTACWFYLWSMPTSGGRFFYSKRTGTGPAGWYSAITNSTSMSFNVANSSSVFVDGAISPSLTSQTWYRILWVWHGAGKTLDAYLNGVALTVTRTTSGTMSSYTANDTAMGLTIGRANADGDSSNSVPAFIDDVCVWKRLLSSREAHEDYVESASGYPNALLRRHFTVGAVQTATPATASFPVREISKGPPMPGAPWFRITVNERPQTQISPPPPVPVNLYAREITIGPPLRGAPWSARLYVEPGLVVPFVPPPVIPPPFIGMREVVGGPPIPGAPWTYFRPWVERKPARDGTAISQATLTTRRPFITRSADEDRRTRRFSEQVAGLLNSLIAKGFISLASSSPLSFNLLAGAIFKNRAPTMVDDATTGAVPGCSWIDQSARKIYFCIDATIGHAVWNGPY